MKHSRGLLVSLPLPQRRRPWPIAIKGFGWFVLLLGLGLGTFPVNAYVLQGAHILELMVKTLDKVHSARIVQKVFVEEGSADEQTSPINETISIAFPDRYRLETNLQKGQRIDVAVFDQTLTVFDGHIVDNPDARLDQYKDLLLYRSRPLLYRKLLIHGVDVEKTSLGRYEDQIVYVLGAQYPDESPAQVWVNKDSFLPLRWIDTSSSVSGDSLEFVYRQWQKRGDLWYPLKIETYRNHRLIRRIEVADIVVNPSLPAELFDIPHLMEKYPTAPKVEADKPSSTAPTDEVKRTIEEFQKKFDD